jgi:hypothetical protein
MCLRKEEKVELRIFRSNTKPQLMASKAVAYSNGNNIVLFWEMLDYPNYTYLGQVPQLIFPQHS